MLSRTLKTKGIGRAEESRQDRGHAAGGELNTRPFGESTNHAAFRGRAVWTLMVITMIQDLHVQHSFTPGKAGARFFYN